MKINIFNAGLMLAILIFAVFTNTAIAQSTKEAPKPKTTTLTVSVTEMGCRTDSKMVETALYRKKGVKSVKITEDVITIDYNPEKLKQEDIIAVIENTGTCEDPNAKVHKVKVKTL